MFCIKHINEINILIEQKPNKIIIPDLVEVVIIEYVQLEGTHQDQSPPPGPMQDTTPGVTPCA